MSIFKNDLAINYVQNSQGDIRNIPNILILLYCIKFNNYTLFANKYININDVEVMILLSYACIKNRMEIVSNIISHNNLFINIGFRYASNISIELIDYFITLGVNNYDDVLAYLIMKNNMDNYNYILNIAIQNNYNIDYHKLYYYSRLFNNTELMNTYSQYENNNNYGYIDCICEFALDYFGNMNNNELIYFFLNEFSYDNLDNIVMLASKYKNYDILNHLLNNFSINKNIIIYVGTDLANINLIHYGVINGANDYYNCLKIAIYKNNIQMIDHILGIAGSINLEALIELSESLGYTSITKVLVEWR
jgi:hypothetical protein